MLAIKSSDCPSTDKWIKEMWYMCAKYYSAMKRNEIESVEVMWLNLELVIQTDLSQKEKNDYCRLTHIYMESRGLPWHFRWKRIRLQCRRAGFNPRVGKIPWRREWQPTSVFLPEVSPWTEETGGL